LQKTEYQLGFSGSHAKAMHDVIQRTQKARKTLSVLGDYLKDLSSLNLLDIGCSTGILTKTYGEKFGSVTGVDIDAPAVEFAVKNHSSDNVRFFVRDSMDTGFERASFDVVTCTQVYEHVPNSNRLMAEIHRLLKPGGICYFAAGNRLCLMEGHYHLPLLSVIPKPFAHVYLRILKRGTYYYENHLTLWGLRKLARQFEIIDYTKKIIESPEKYSLDEMLAQGSFKQKIALAVVRTAYWLVPTYIWLLRKPDKVNRG
jgi:2-polyprenyl-3-methyl-5-hydroxy-6-metoxy-1,4-benzoquinol methylase